MEEDKGKLDEFKEIYRGEMLNKEDVHRIEYFGSTKDSWKWKAGKSDLDIKVYGDDIPAKVRIDGILLIERLNYELGLKLEYVPLQHWTPIYIDSPNRRYLDRLSEEALVRTFMESIRSNVKEVIKEFGWPITHKGWWNIVKAMKALETLPIPKLSKLL